MKLLEKVSYLLLSRIKFFSIYLTLKVFNNDYPKAKIDLLSTIEY